MSLQLAEPLPILGNNTTSQPIRRLFLYSPLHLTQKKRDSALKCIQKKKLKQYLKDNNINTTIEDLTEEQLADFNSSPNKKGPKYNMTNVKIVMPMKPEEC